jgi:DNA polymerase-3 subunit epsilon
VGFLQAALERDDRPRLTNRTVDTVALARRLVRDEVPNCKLGTLAQRFRLDHTPSHRALDDALATGDLLHVLLERAGGLGVTGLDDLLALPTMAGHAQASKLRLTDRLPRSPGVYLFRGARGEVLYVGKATNLRARVRSYFSGDERRKIGTLLRETQKIDHVVHPHPLSAAVHEVRLIHRFTPRFNRQSKDWSKYVYVKLTLEETYPRLSVVKASKADGGLYLGPLSSKRTAQRVIEAIQTAVPLRRCTQRVGRDPARQAPCTAAQLGVSMCPCAGGVDPNEYRKVVERAVRGLTVEPELLLVPLADRLEALARSERFEEAADVRDRAEALTSALRRQRRFDALRRAGHLRLQLPDQGGAELRGGRLVRAWAPHATPVTGSDDPRLFLDEGPLPPLDRDLADELACVAAWLDRSAHAVTLEHCEGLLASTLPALPSFAPRGGLSGPRGGRRGEPSAARSGSGAPGRSGVRALA